LKFSPVFLSLGRDDKAFEECYGNARDMSAIVLAIRSNAVKRGMVKRRRSKNGCPNERFAQQDSTEADGL
jgi:hypothetical protein